jgi:succinyl-diaminopimelate desuccinylase
MNPTLTLTCELIARPSVTPEDAGCLDLIGQRLERLGFGLEPMPRADVSNLWATLGHGGPVFCFAGHTDVVPPGDLADWTSDPFLPVITDGFLYGRGAADMKGSLAAMVTATERFLARCPQPRGTLAFLLTSDEEGVATHGTRHVVETLMARGQPLDYCLIGEPSSQQRLGDLLRNGRRGSLNGRLTIEGVQGHVAYPDRARNPIHLAAPALAALAALNWDPGNEFFPPTSFQISNVNSGTGAENVIPPRLEARFNFRFSTESTPEQLKARVKETLDAHGLDYRIEWHLSGEPFLTGRGRLVEAVVGALDAELAVTPELSTGGGTSDGRFIAKMGCEVLELGPNNATIHKINERVPVHELEQLSRVYEEVLVRLLG